MYISLVMWKPRSRGSGDFQVFTSLEGLHGSSVGQEQSMTLKLTKHFQKPRWIHLTKTNMLFFSCRKLDMGTFFI